MFPATADRICVIFVSGYAAILSSAYLLDLRGLLASTSAWTAALVTMAATIAVAAHRLARSPCGAGVLECRSVSTLPRWLLHVIVLSVAVALAADILVLLSVAPASWDALSYHLPRMAYALQNGSFELDVANYWAQQAHPIGSTALFVFTYVLSRTEGLVAAWQLLAVIAAAGATWMIGFSSFSSRPAATFGALTFLLTTQALMQANTVGNDAIVAALAGCATAWLLQGRATSDARYFALSPVAAGLGLATKATFALIVPLLLGVSVFALAGVSRRTRSKAAFALAAGCCVGAAFAAPAGYVQNVRRYGHPLGPESVRLEHTFEGVPVSDRFAGGTLNVFRFTADFISLDGLPRVAAVNDLQRRIRHGVGAFFASVGLNLESRHSARVPFQHDRIASAHEVHAYWGVIGVLIIWPAVLLSLGRGATIGQRLPAALAVAFLLLQAYSGPYDPWRGRYFLTAAVFAAPTTAWWLTVRRRPVRLYRDGCLLLACASALSATMLRSNLPLIGVSRPGIDRPSILGRDRLSQMTVNRRELEAPLRKFESLVPTDATVAVRLPSDSFEYPLFGKALSRTIFPAPPGVELSAVAGFQYLLFDEELEPVRAGDCPLGTGWWLRPGTPCR